ncbi:hypothetical protein QR680_018812 [Steinernema hermaphroditum]|uniref:Uncharacterized protein n=1 Tax=Steinernema hermaphroditum TaxID=289476 RepID=A0AA39HKC7_9BILA|nr:hypothetical protein QR680_018812 [Steinernema hermaphroditum]
MKIKRLLLPTMKIKKHTKITRTNSPSLQGQLYNPADAAAQGRVKHCGVELERQRRSTIFDSARGPRSRAKDTYIKRARASVVLKRIAPKSPCVGHFAGSASMGIDPARL